MPDMRGPRDDAAALGALAMVITVFLALVGQGCPPKEALTFTLTLAMGGAEVVRRLPGGRDDEPPR